jgi:hypothetical protein
MEPPLYLENSLSAAISTNVQPQPIWIEGSMIIKAGRQAYGPVLYRNVLVGSSPTTTATPRRGKSVAAQGFWEYGSASRRLFSQHGTSVR